MNELLQARLQRGASTGSFVPVTLDWNPSPNPAGIPLGLEGIPGLADDPPPSDQQPSPKQQ